MGQRSEKGTSRSGHWRIDWICGRRVVYGPCPILCLIRVDGTPRKDSGLSRGTCGDRGRERWVHAQGCCPVRCPIAWPFGLHDRTRRRGERMSMDNEGMYIRCLIAWPSDPTIGQACMVRECRWAMRGCPAVRSARRDTDMGHRSGSPGSPGRGLCPLSMGPWANSSCALVSASKIEEPCNSGACRADRCAARKSRRVMGTRHRTAAKSLAGAGPC